MLNVGEPTFIVSNDNSCTNLAVLANELESLDEAKSFVDRATNREIVDGDVLNNTLRIDDEQATAQANMSFLSESERLRALSQVRL
jgi:hypothetical protein